MSTFPDSPSCRRARRIPGLIFLLIFCVNASAQEVLWKEDFSEVPDGPYPTAQSPNVVREEGGIRFLAKENKETEFLFKRESLAAGGKDWTDTLTRVRFRFSTTCTVSLVLKVLGGRPEIPFQWYYVSLSKTRLDVNCTGTDRSATAGDPRKDAAVIFSEAGFSDLVADTWTTLSVATGNDTIIVRLKQEDGEEGEWEFKVFPGTGASHLLLRSPTDVDEIVVEKLPQPVTGKH